MMHELSKEQAEWLIKSINRKNAEQVCDGGDLTGMELIEYVINQCTEKKFPTLYVTDINAIHFLTISSGAPISGNWAYFSSAGGHLDKGQLKQFIKGCNQIVEYLESQDV